MLILLKSLPSLISYDVICAETLHLNNFARFSQFEEQMVALDSPDYRVRTCKILLKTIKSS